MAIFLVVIFSIQGASFGEDGVVILDPVDPFVKAASQSLYEDHLKAKARNRLHYIFLPGVLGSRLVEKGNSPSEDKIIWGAASISASRSESVSKLKYSPDQSYRPEVLKEFSVYGFDADIYGSAFVSPGFDTTNGMISFDGFGYDWRQDIRKSSAQFQSWLCQNQNKFSEGRIIFIGHSMGGLVLKEWFRSNWDPRTKCDGGTELKLNVDRVLFVGTPFYGSPKAIKSFAQGMSLLGYDVPNGKSSESIKLIAAATNYLDRQVFSDVLNEAGPSFPSAYQLLPFYEQDCFNDILRKMGRKADSSVTLPQPLVAVDENGTPFSYPDLFLPDTWQALGWPGNKTGITDLNEYYSQILPQRLKDAYDFQCALNGYEMPTSIVVEYFYGTLKNPPTESSYTVRKKGTNYEWVGASGQNGMTYGDGTVPQDIASAIFLGPNSSTVHSIAAAHMKLVNVDEFASFIRYYNQTARVRAQSEAASSPEKSKIMGRAYAMARLFPPLGTLSPAQGVDQVSLTVFEEFAKESHIPLDAGAEAAFRIPDPNDREKYFYYLANSPNSTPTVAAWSANDLTHLQFQLNKPSFAVETAVAAKSSSYWKLLPERERDNVEVKLDSNLGWSLYKLGQDELAFKSWERSLSLDPDYPAAQRGIEALGGNYANMAREGYLK
jgi:tetratricopeptide (TPR) repeat protein/pimeloyl-ACP methyl ester carboxylesterase